jgi:diacylglycerol kinase
VLVVASLAVLVLELLRSPIEAVLSGRVSDGLRVRARVYLRVRV